MTDATDADAADRGNPSSSDVTPRASFDSATTAQYGTACTVDWFSFTISYTVEALISLVPYVGPSFASVVSSALAPDNAAAVDKAQKAMYSAQSEAMGALREVTEIQQQEIDDIVSAVSGPNGYVAALAASTAHALNQEVAMIAINCCMLFVMVVLIVWAL